ncbi:MAG TPA: MdtA/MuxA family multidrug efflux RND transporter periplasmic adaptor subunit [Thermoanaerobaculia bacterium]
MKLNLPDAPSTETVQEPERSQVPQPQPEPSVAPEPQRTHRRRWPWLLGLGVIGLIAWLIFPRAGHKPSESDETAKGSAKGAATARPVPVVAATARTGDLGVYITGLGTVTALNTVTVRSRVDGQLMRVAFREGQLVRQGELLAEVDPRPFQVQLTQAEGQMAKDQATLQNAIVDLERYRVLFQQDAIPQQQLATQAATVRQLEASLKSDQGQIDSAKLNIVYSRITAPVSGRVGLRLVDAGNIVHATDQNGLVVITQLQPITVVFTIPADRLAQVQAPMRSGRRLEVDAYDRELKNKLATGSLMAVDNQIDPTTGTVRLKAQFENADSALFPNQFVNARLLVDTLRSTIIVPAAAIQRSPQSAYVYVVRKDATAEMRNVEVQLTEGEDTAIRRGVASGEAVVIDGIDKLQPGSKVAVNMANANGSRKPSS